jgi:hypothetical protein
MPNPPSGSDTSRSLSPMRLVHETWPVSMMKNSLPSCRQTDVRDHMSALGEPPQGKDQAVHRWWCGPPHLPLLDDHLPRLVLLGVQRVGQHHPLLLRQRLQQRHLWALRYGAGAVPLIRRSTTASTGQGASAASSRKEGRGSVAILLLASPAQGSGGRGPAASAPCPAGSS